MIQEINVLFDDFPHLLVRFILQPALQVGFVVIETLGRVGTGDLDIGDSGQHHHQMPYLDFNIGMGQHRNIGRRNKIKQEFIFSDRKAVLGEAPDSQKLLHRASFFLFLPFVIFQSLYCTSVCFS